MQPAKVVVYVISDVEVTSLEWIVNAIAKSKTDWRTSIIDTIDP